MGRKGFKCHLPTDDQSFLSSLTGGISMVKYFFVFPWKCFGISMVSMGIFGISVVFHGISIVLL